MAHLDQLEQELGETLAREIVREILREKVGNIVDADSTMINDMWDKCGGNPWNAGILYDLFQTDEYKRLGV